MYILAKEVPKVHTNESVSAVKLKMCYALPSRIRTTDIAEMTGGGRLSPDGEINQLWNPVSKDPLNLIVKRLRDLRPVVGSRAGIDIRLG